jgi:hypothetical protein
MWQLDIDQIESLKLNSIMRGVVIFSNPKIRLEKSIQRGEGQWLISGKWELCEFAAVFVKNTSFILFSTYINLLISN